MDFLMVLLKKVDMRKITPNEIDYSKSYTGYLWYSDKSTPMVFPPETLDHSMFTQLPFILEGYLYSPEEGGICVNIKNIDGDYLIYEARLKDVDQNKIERYTFLTSPVFENIGIKRFNAIQFWSAEKDEFCENMEVLQPAWIALEGFEYTTRPENL